MIKVDISNVWGEIALPDLLNMEKEVFAAHKTLDEGTGEGNDFLGWLNLPVTEETDEIRRIRAAAKRIREQRNAYFKEKAVERAIERSREKQLRGED